MGDVKQRPILFSSPMVNAILDDRKSMTRRVMKIQPDSDGRVDCHDGFAYVRGPRGGQCVKEPSPYGAVGDTLWVRETHTIDVNSVLGMAEPETRLIYRADKAARYLESDDEEFFYLGSDYKPDKWTPSIFMPKWACRIHLTITDVRVERLHDISCADAIAEGIPQTCGEAHKIGLIDMDKTPGHEYDNRTSIENLSRLWDSINAKKHPWKSNPWVWVISFLRGRV